MNGWTTGEDLYRNVRGQHRKGLKQGGGEGEIAIQMLERMYRRKLTAMCMNRFEWTGLPADIPRRYLEMVLYYNALCVFFRHPQHETFFALRGYGVDQPNIYDDPTRFRVYGNGIITIADLNYSIVDRFKECVPIWANYERVPDHDIVRIYARRLAEVDRTIDINVQNARHPKVLRTTQNTQLSLVNTARQVDQGAGLLQVTGDIADNIEALDLGILPDVHEKVHVLRARLFNEAMGLLGIDNANQDKKERIVKGEHDANDEQVSLMRGINLNARQEAAEEINRVYAEYGLDVQVRYRGEGGDPAGAILPEDDMLAAETGTEGE